MSKFCKNCGAQLMPGVKSCTSCGTETQVTGAKTLEVPSVGAAAKMTANAVFAAASAGEVCFAHALPQDFSTTIGPFKCLFKGLTGLFRGFGATFKDKKRWIPVLILALTWFILTLLPLLGVNPMSVRLLSFLTFAQGGTSGGLLGVMGGVVGKGVFAYFLFSLVVPLAQGKKPFEGVLMGLKQFVPSPAANTPAKLSGLLAGMGAALIVYNFMTGSVSLRQSMVGVAAFFLSLRALSHQTGFFRRMMGSLVNLIRKNKRADSKTADCLLAGWAAGFALAVPISAIPFAQIGYASSALLLIIALVLKIVSFSKKEVAA